MSRELKVEKKKKKKPTHGGARKGAGRHKASYELKVIKVPVPIIPAVKKLILDFKDGLKKKTNSQVKREKRPSPPIE